jgi:glycosyltransferase involved in cell wall biosynthesis
MRALFIHQNFPGQFRHLAPALALQPGNQIVGVGETANLQRQMQPAGVQLLGYDAPPAGSGAHHYLRKLEGAVRRGQAVARVLLALKQKGFVPDLVYAHPGWGEALYVKDVFPDTRLLAYCEFLYRSEGANFNFDPEFPGSFDARLRVRTEAAGYLLTLEAMDHGITPTHWQHSVHPIDIRERISVIHDGIDTTLVKPDPAAVFEHAASGLRLTRNDEVLTYVSRNLEPARGFHIFMRALPEILRARPRARAVIVGGDEVSYSGKPKGYASYREMMLAEVGDRLDLSRVHFLGKIPYASYLKLLQVSAVHVYLTTPFVLSWSLLEAMAAGCLIVASDTAPVREVIKDGETGYLVDFFSISALQSAVVNALGERKSRIEITAAARRQTAERYDLGRVCLPAQLNCLAALSRGHVPGNAETGGQSWQP